MNTFKPNKLLGYTTISLFICYVYMYTCNRHILGNKYKNLGDRFFQWKSRGNLMYKYHRTQRTWTIEKSWSAVMWLSFSTGRKYSLPFANLCMLMILSQTVYNGRSPTRSNAPEATRIHWGDDQALRDRGHKGPCRKQELEQSALANMIHAWNDCSPTSGRKPLWWTTQEVRETFT